ncbi:MAG: sigma-54 dependent transcriptional regulator [Notoacmeibacter sp.]|nr:sigma-54 dependent transcriptional regulator [Notoacmeibacter sp.]
MTRTILAVDDDPVQRRLAEAALVKFGYKVLQADGGEAALEVMEGPQGGDVAAVVLDLVMPDMDGLTVLKTMRARGIDAPVIVQTSKGGIDTVIGAMRAGAFDFVVKPVSPDRLQNAVSNALKVEEMEGASKKVRRSPAKMSTFKDIVTRSETMDRVLKLARKAAASNIPIMIEGESGVGKELVARAICGSGNRSDGPFVTVNCGAIPENLVESILFGHEKGSFTGATDKHVGKFVEANGGTLFLDEIGDLPLEAQVKLLRAVQEGEVDPVGGKKPQKVDIRIISATHCDLLQAVREGKFREDLFYRLNVFPIRVPPLRERREDIALLVHHFIGQFAGERAGTAVTGIADNALAILEAYDWPGNIRQLENAVFRAMVLAEGDLLTGEEFPQIRAQVDEAELARTLEAEADTPAGGASIRARETVTPAGEPASSSGQPVVRTKGTLHPLDERGDVRMLADIEREMIVFAIDHYRGQMSEVARRLGIGRSTLYRKLKEFGIEAEEGRAHKLAS